MRRLVFALLPLSSFAVGCGEDLTGPGNVLSGVWAYNDAVGSASYGTYCASSGTLTVEQSGDNFTGTVNATPDCNDGSSITGGQINGSEVSFQIGACQFTGRVSGSPPSSMRGTKSCPARSGGTRYLVSGPWAASRSVVPNP
jgi:hypothetical protein